jgi:DNA invertase Pin-like site-specific DNA recombinase
MTTRTTGPLRAAIYCRISLARFGDTVKVDDQERLCRELAGQRGWTVQPRHVYKDNSMSAWRRSRRRHGWDAMLTAIEAGEVDAIVVYHGDRLIRQPWDLELLLRIADEKRLRLASVAGDRNLDNPDDRYILRIEAAGNCRESDNTSRRLKRHFVRLEEQGRCRLGGRGGRAFGFEPDGMTIRQSDADMLREVADRILTGEAVGEICRDLNRRGFRTTTDGEWDHGALKKLMLRPRLAGLLARHGRIVGPAAWPAILDRDTWEAVRATLERKAAAFLPYTTNARKYLLTSIAECGSCGEPLPMKQSKHGSGYLCVNLECPRRVSRSQHHLDEYVAGACVELLNDRGLVDRLARDPDSGENVGAQIIALEARRKGLLDVFDSSPLMTPAELAKRLESIDAQVTELRSRQLGSTRAAVLAPRLGITREQWEDLPLSTRRTIVQHLMRVRVLPGRKGPGFDPRTVDLVPID